MEHKYLRLVQINILFIMSVEMNVTIKQKILMY